MKHVLTALYLTFLLAACTKEDLKPVSVEQDEFIITVTATHSQPYGDVIRTLSQAVRLTVNKDRSVTDTEGRRWANQPDAIQEASLKVIAALEALIEASEVHNER